MPITPMKPVPAATRPRTGATASRTAAPAPVAGTPAADPAGHVLAWLGRHQGFDALTARAEVLLALQADLDCLDTSATGGARRLTALGLQDDVLVLSAPGAALAAKLRQIEPSLLAGLAVRGWKVKRIRIQPQPPRQGAPTPPPTPKAPVPASAVAAFEALGRQVDDPGLKRALARFVARRRRSGP